MFLVECVAKEQGNATHICEVLTLYVATNLVATFSSMFIKLIAWNLSGMHLFRGSVLPTQTL